jgi:hypothetical protein
MLSTKSTYRYPWYANYQLPSVTRAANDPYTIYVDTYTLHERGTYFDEGREWVRMERKCIVCKETLDVLDRICYKCWAECDSCGSCLRLNTASVFTLQELLRAKDRDITLTSANEKVRVCETCSRQYFPDYFEEEDIKEPDIV